MMTSWIVDIASSRVAGPILGARSRSSGLPDGERVLIPAGRRCAWSGRGRQERFDILDATFLFRQGDLTAPIHDEGLAERLGIGPGGRATLAALRDAAQFFQEDR